nr:putative Ca2+-dependent phospholipid-binding protein [Ipomoea batatas]
MKHKDLNPEWNEEFSMVVKDPESQVLEIYVYDWEQVGKHEKMAINGMLYAFRKLVTGLLGKSLCAQRNFGCRSVVSLSLFSTEVIISVFTMVRYNKANEIPVLKVPMQIIQCSTGTNPIYICHISKISLSSFYGNVTYAVIHWWLPEFVCHFFHIEGMLRRRHVHGPGSSPRLVHAPHTEHHDDADNTIQEIKRKHHHDVQCGEHVRGGDPTRVCEHGDDVAGNTQNNNGSEADGVEHYK